MGLLYKVNEPPRNMKFFGGFFMLLVERIFHQWLLQPTIAYQANEYKKPASIQKIG
jgi:hypothetical protein